MAALIPLIIQISLILVMSSVGLRSRWSDLAFAVRRPALLLRAIVAVNVVVPVVAILALLWLPIAPVIKLGVVLMAVSPLAPLVPGKMLKLGADTSFTVGLYVALVLASVVIVPVTFALLSAMFPTDVTLPPGVLAAYMVETVLIPLGAGLLISGFAPGFAASLGRIADIAGKIGVLLILVLVLYKFAALAFALAENGLLFAIIAIVAAALAAGHWLGGPGPADRQALAIAAATRHPGIAILVAKRHDDDQRVVLAIILFLLVSIIVSAVYERWAKRGAGAAPAGNASGTD